YSSRRGINIGNLVDGREYYVILDDEPGWIKLAETERQALEASVGHEAGNIVDLMDTIPTTNNTSPFERSDVDIDNDTIRLDRLGGNFNSFESGEAVVYAAGPDGAIGGLEHGKTYYIITATTEDN